jgi:hypothetical protein
LDPSLIKCPCCGAHDIALESKDMTIDEIQVEENGTVKTVSQGSGIAHIGGETTIYQQKLVINGRKDFSQHEKGRCEKKGIYIAIEMKGIGNYV